MVLELCCVGYGLAGRRLVVDRARPELGLSVRIGGDLGVCLGGRLRLCGATRESAGEGCELGLLRAVAPLLLLGVAFKRTVWWLSSVG